MWRIYIWRISLNAIGWATVSLRMNLYESRFVKTYNCIWLDFQVEKNFQKFESIMWGAMSTTFGALSIKRMEDLSL